jgi:hypothetical protein
MEDYMYAQISFNKTVYSKGYGCLNMFERGLFKGYLVDELMLGDGS